MLRPISFAKHDLTCISQGQCQFDKIPPNLSFYQDKIEENPKKRLSDLHKLWRTFTTAGSPPDQRVIIIFNKIEALPIL